MITYKQGDLFDEIGHVDVIVNTVNMEGVMGKGIALQFKKRFPQMFEAYKHVCQSRGIDFERPHLFCAPFSSLTVVSGTAKGADTMGEEYTKFIGYDVSRIPAPWNDLGNKAGMIRNIEMAHYADVVIAFWDGKSPGTKQMIDYAGSLGKLAAVIQY